MKWISLIVFLFICSCQSTNKDNRSVETFSLNKYKQITFIGDNEQPFFSESGNSLLFISSKRFHHKSAQVYELDLLKNSERRITFHDGEDSRPLYIDRNQILYFSNTDEIKENLLLSNENKALAAGADLYMSDLFGNDIERLTHSPGFDGDGIYIKGLKPHIYASSLFKNQICLIKIDPHTHNTNVILSEQNKEFRYPAQSPNGKELAFIEKDLKQNQYSIKLLNLITKKVTELTTSKQPIEDLVWNANLNKLIYTRTQQNQKTIIEFFDSEQKCVVEQIQDAYSLKQANVSNRGTLQIAFTLIQNGNKQIYMGPLNKNLGTCIEPQNLSQ